MRETILSAIAGLALLGATACDTGPSSPVDPGLPGDGDIGGGDGAETTIETYQGDWTIFAVNLGEPDGGAFTPDTVQGNCSGSVTLTTRTSASGNVEILAGSYVVLADAGCSAGSTMSGALVDIDFRQDGGIDFGLDVPGSDNNMFEDFLVGSGLQFDHIRPLGCGDPQALGGPGGAKDEVNHLDGTLLEARLRAAASASMTCPDVLVDPNTGEIQVNGESIVQVKISVDVTRGS